MPENKVPDGKEDVLKRKNDTLRETILFYAREIADREGLERINIRSIAKKAGIASGTVYNYFSNKDEILLALTEEYWHQALLEMETVVQGDSFCEQVEQIFIFLRERIDSTAGKLMGTSSTIWYMALGTLMVLMALQTWEIFNFIPSVNLLSKSKKRGFVGAFLAGILGGIFSSPCSTPVLIALLAIVAGEGNLLWGILLMLLYSVGHSALVMVAGTSVGFVQKINSSETYNKAAKVIKLLMGMVILLIGLYMFWIAF